METNDTQSNSSKPKTKKFAVIGITAGLLLGAGSGVLMNLPGGASAKSTTPQAISANDNSTDTSTPAAREAKLRETLQTLVAAGTIDASDVDAIVTALSTKPTTPPAADTTGARPDKATMLKARLQTLVDDGTLTSSQLDAVVTALEAARPMGGGHEGRGHGGQNHGGQNNGGARGEKRQEMLTSAAEAIGITADALKTVKGLGPAKRAELVAVLELARRALAQQLTQKPLFNTPQAVRDYLQLQLGGLHHEVFAVLFLDSQHRLIALEEMFRGTLTQTSVYPREVVKHALTLNASSVVLAHNHPSGTAQPSRADEALTHTLKAALALVDVRVLDHFVVTASQAVSMAELGLV
jgi:DNA repair protein RadC